MTFQAMAWALDHSETGGTDRLLMLALAHHADNDGYVALSRATIASETRMSDATVKRTLARLLETVELAEADPECAPDWWRAIRVDRRPRLLLLASFAATRTGGQIEPPSNGTGGQRGVNPRS